MTKESELTSTDFEKFNQQKASIDPTEILRRVKNAMQDIEKYDLIDVHLWKLLREEFEGYTEDHFSLISKIKVGTFRAMIRKRDVWGELSRLSAFKAIVNMLVEENQALWSIEEVRNVHRRKEFIFKELLEFVKHAMNIGYEEDENQNRDRRFSIMPNPKHQQHGQQQHGQKQQQQQRNQSGNQPPEHRQQQRDQTPHQTANQTEN